MMLMWSVPGVDLAIPKGQYGATVDWIGATITVDDTAVSATIQQHRL